MKQLGSTALFRQRHNPSIERVLPDGSRDILGIWIENNQADLAGPAQHHPGLGASGTELEICNEPVCDPLRRPIHETAHLKSPPSFTKSVKVQ
ncbi:MAG: hypothetical protein IV097_00355 [Burkholderiaceae bacterium]|nr:hypothetical protein [Burkholderiaceae bacterium]